MTGWLLTIWAVFACGLGVSVAVYVRTVLPTLRAKGLKPSWPEMTPSQQWHQVRLYKRVCDQEGRSLVPYRALVWGQVVALTAGAVWVVLALTWGVPD